jgi:5-methylcytosine-specific restriction endonuclease McrA
MDWAKIEKKDKDLIGWRAKGYLKWGTKCEVCDSKDKLQGHHFFSYKRHKALRYDVLNFVPLCKSCHFKLERTKDLDIAYQIIIKRGLAWLKRLRNKL